MSNYRSKKLREHQALKRQQNPTPRHNIFKLQAKRIKDKEKA